jgi:hypothetical protein
MEVLMRKLLLVGILPLALAACKNHEATYKESYQPRNATAEILPMGPERLRNSKKRGFADFNGDGFEDMVQVNDEAWFGQDYQMDIFFGKNMDGRLGFEETPVRVSLPITFSWFSSAIKLDTADTNGDGYADIVFTQYNEKWGDDTLDVAIAVNNGDMTFTAHDLSTSAASNANDFQDFDVFMTVMMHQTTGVFYPYEESIYDVLKMDWADMDGNGTDDVILAWDNGYDIDVRIIYTQENPSNGIVGLRADMADKGQLAYEQVYMEGFTKNMSIRNFDTEDYNGDGIGDMVLYYASGKAMKTRYILSGDGVYEAYKRSESALPSVDMFAAAKKVDTMDVDFDGCADVVKITEQDNVAVMLVLYQDCATSE